MSNGNKVEVFGINELIQAFDDLERKVILKVMRKAQRSALNKILKAAKAAAPRDSGDLVKGMKLRAGRRRTGKIPLNLVVAPQNGETFYGNFLEFGYTKNGIVYPPRHFMTDTFNRMKDGAAMEMMVNTRDGLIAAAEAMGKKVP